MIILDTNVVSEVMRLTADPSVIAWLDNQAEGSIWITSATVLEVRTGIELLPPGRRRTTLSFDFERFLDTDIQGRVVAFDSDAAHATASITAARRRLGRPGELRDSMIAGIALSTGASLATRNTRHFDDLTIALIDPWAT
ncbi:MAG: type II toxin-antitoxin system VapC family toxin [Rhodopila sp.]|nr:type II toxin-antitoxin system VapC family toxin [Rhodopila sp.]